MSGNGTLRHPGITVVDKGNDIPAWPDRIIESIRRFSRQQTPPAPRSDDGQHSGRL
jgi:hypothetical protein